MPHGQWRRKNINEIGTRLYLEADSVDVKDNVPGIREIKIYFAEFLRLLVDSFTRKIYLRYGHNIFEFK